MIQITLYKIQLVEERSSQNESWSEFKNEQHNASAINLPEHCFLSVKGNTTGKKE